MGCLVSVCCLAYNQKKYIRQCLDSLICQETDFDYEIIVHDDASTDGTTDVIREYEMVYPSIVKPIYQRENQYSQIGISGIYHQYVFPKAGGTFLAFCEGDDYWTDIHKIQMQVDALVEHPSCHMCVHAVQAVSEGGDTIDLRYPQKQMKTEVLDSIRFMKGLTDGYFFHTTSFFCRKKDIDLLLNELPSYYKQLDVDDVPLLLFMGQLGENFYLDRCMSAYRRYSNGSWTNRQKDNIECIIKHKLKMIDMYKAYNSYTSFKYKDLCQHWIANEEFMIYEYRHDFKRMVEQEYREFLRDRDILYIIKVYLASVIQRVLPNFMR